MTLPDIDYTQLTDSEVAQLKSEAELEKERRIRVALAPQKVEEVAFTFLQDVGRSDGSDWVQPTGAHDAYPLGYKVVKDDITWESLIPANTTVPGTDPRWWKDLTTVYPEGMWNPNYISYVVGDLVIYDEIQYECVQDHTSQPDWTPLLVPALWRVVDFDVSTGMGSGETIFVGTAFGNSTEEPAGPSVWDSNSITYAVNDQVMYNGLVYRCLQQHTSQPGWTPEAVPALWAQV